MTHIALTRRASEPPRINGPAVPPTRSVLAGLLFALVASQGVEPRPQDAVTAILAAFDRYDVVGMNAAHSNETQDDLILELVQTRAFASKVNDVVIECGQT